MIAPPADGHVHTEWSWDAPMGSMLDSCRRALQIGLPSITFTDHADFVEIHQGQRRLDVAGYHEAVERCRRAFPELRVLSGVELGEPHWFPAEAAAVLDAGHLDMVLGSVHCASLDGRVMDASQVRDAKTAPEFMRRHLAESLALVQSTTPFGILTHLDYPKRFWPHEELEFRPGDYEEELRVVLVALAARQGVLEVNTTRGMDPLRGLCPGPEVIRWWYEAGGSAVSFGSDAHDPSMIAMGFPLAAAAVEAAGFRATDDPADFWRR